MKVAIISVLLAAVVYADYGTNINNFANGGQDHHRSILRDTSHGHNQGQVNNKLRDLHHFDGARDRLAAHGNTYKGQASQAGQKSSKNAISGHKADQHFAKQDAKIDEVARQIAEAAHNRGYQSAAHGKYDKLDNNRARGYNAAAANKKAFNNGKVFSDDINYGFNKHFNQNLSERGGLEEENGHNAHKLDEYKDRQRARKLIRGDHSAANARQDAQRALKESKYNQNAAQKQAANGKFGNSDKKLDKAGATQDSQRVKYDRKDNKFHAEDAGTQQALKKNNEFANKDNAFGRQAAASHAGAQDHKDKKYYGGHGSDGSGNLVGGGAGGGAGGYGAHGGPVPVQGGSAGGSHGEGSGGLTNHKYGENAKQTDQGKEHLAQAAGASDAAIKGYKQAKNQGEFAQLKSLADHRDGRFAQGVHDAQNNGFHSKDATAAKTANGNDRKFADAAAQSNAKAAKHDLDEAAFDKENFKRNQQDRSENFKKLRRFFHDKKNGGDNVENLKYNRKRVENAFGEVQAAQKEHQNQFDKNHRAAKHNAAARRDNYQDAKKASNGFSLHNANRHANGRASNRANAFNKANQFAHGNKKEIQESDFSNHKDALLKKQQDHHDNAQGQIAATNNGYKNAAAEDSQRTGNGGSTNNLLRGDAHRRPQQNRDFQADVAPIRGADIHGQFQNFRRPTNTRPRQVNQFGSIKGNNFGNFGNKNRGRSVGTIQSGYGGGHGKGSSFGNFGSGSSFGFGSGSGSGGKSFSSFGLGRASSFGSGSSFGKSRGGRGGFLLNGLGSSFGSSFGSGFRH